MLRETFSHGICSKDMFFIMTHHWLTFREKTVDKRFSLTNLSKISHFVAHRGRVLPGKAKLCLVNYYNKAKMNTNGHWPGPVAWRSENVRITAPCGRGSATTDTEPRASASGFLPIANEFAATGSQDYKLLVGHCFTPDCRWLPGGCSAQSWMNFKFQDAAHLKRRLPQRNPARNQ